MTNTPTVTPERMNTADTMARFGVSRKWLERARQAGLIRAAKTGDTQQASVTYRVSDLVEYFESHENKRREERIQA